MKKKNKNNYFIFGIAVILILASITGFYYYENKKSLDIKEYKRELYNAFICQYGCPLSEKVVMNKTELVSDVGCMKNCSVSVTSKKWDKVSKMNLTEDNLFNDIVNTINTCKLTNYNNLTKQIAVSPYFVCVTSGLESLKQNYTYLL